MTVRATTLVSRIEKAFPNVEGVEARGKRKVFLGDVAEGAEFEGLPLCDYYNNLEGSYYTFGVHNKLWKLVEKAGWFVECYDPGTYFAYPM